MRLLRTPERVSSINSCNAREVPESHTTSDNIPHQDSSIWSSVLNNSLSSHLNVPWHKAVTLITVAGFPAEETSHEHFDLAAGECSHCLDQDRKKIFERNSGKCVTSASYSSNTSSTPISTDSRRQMSGQKLVSPTVDSGGSSESLVWKLVKNIDSEEYTDVSAVATDGKSSFSEFEKRRILEHLRSKFSSEYFGQSANLFRKGTKDALKKAPTFSESEITTLDYDTRSQSETCQMETCYKNIWNKTDHPEKASKEYIGSNKKINNINSDPSEIFDIHLTVKNNSSDSFSNCVVNIRKNGNTQKSNTAIEQEFSDKNIYQNNFKLKNTSLRGNIHSYEQSTNTTNTTSEEFNVRFYNSKKSNESDACTQENEHQESSHSSSNIEPCRSCSTCKTEQQIRHLLELLNNITLSEKNLSADKIKNYKNSKPDYENYNHNSYTADVNSIDKFVDKSLSNSEEGASHLKSCSDQHILKSLQSRLDAEKEIHAANAHCIDLIKYIQNKLDELEQIMFTAKLLENASRNARLSKQYKTDREQNIKVAYRDRTVRLLDMSDTTSLRNSSIYERQYDSENLLRQTYQLYSLGSMAPSVSLENSEIRSSNEHDTPQCCRENCTVGKVVRELQHRISELEQRLNLRPDIDKNEITGNTTSMLSNKDYEEGKSANKVSKEEFSVQVPENTISHSRSAPEMADFDIISTEQSHKNIADMIVDETSEPEDIVHKDKSLEHFKSCTDISEKEDFDKKTTINGVNQLEREISLEQQEESQVSSSVGHSSNDAVSVDIEETRKDKSSEHVESSQHTVSSIKDGSDSQSSKNHHDEFSTNVLEETESSASFQKEPPGLGETKEHKCLADCNSANLEDKVEQCEKPCPANICGKNGELANRCQKLSKHSSLELNKANIIRSDVMHKTDSKSSNPDAKNELEVTSQTTSIKDKSSSRGSTATLNESIASHKSTTSSLKSETLSAKQSASNRSNNKLTEEMKSTSLEPDMQHRKSATSHIPASPRRSITTSLKNNGRSFTVHPDSKELPIKTLEYIPVASVEKELIDSELAADDKHVCRAFCHSNDLEDPTNATQGTCTIDLCSKKRTSTAPKSRPDQHQPINKYTSLQNVERLSPIQSREEKSQSLKSMSSSLKDKSNSRRSINRTSIGDIPHVKRSSIDQSSKNVSEPCEEPTSELDANLTVYPDSKELSIKSHEYISVASVEKELIDSELNIEHSEGTLTTPREDRSSADRSLKDLDTIANKSDEFEKSPKSQPELDIKSPKSTTRRVTIESLRDLYEKRSSIDHSIKNLEHIIQNELNKSADDEHVCRAFCHSNDLEDPTNATQKTCTIDLCSKKRTSAAPKSRPDQPQPINKNTSLQNVQRLSPIQSRDEKSQSLKSMTPSLKDKSNSRRSINKTSIGDIPHVKSSSIDQSSKNVSEPCEEPTSELDANFTAYPDSKKLSIKSHEHISVASVEKELTDPELNIEHSEVILTTPREERSSADRSLKDLDMIANKSDEFEKSPKSQPELDIESQKSSTRRITIESLRDLYEKRSSIDHSIKNLEHIIQNELNKSVDDEHVCRAFCHSNDLEDPTNATQKTCTIDLCSKKRTSAAPKSRPDQHQPVNKYTSLQNVQHLSPIQSREENSESLSRVTSSLKDKSNSRRSSNRTSIGDIPRVKRSSIDQSSKNVSELFEKPISELDAHLKRKSSSPRTSSITSVKNGTDILKKASPASHSSKEAQFPDDLQSSAEPLSNFQEEQRKSTSLKSDSLRSAGLIPGTIHENVDHTSSLASVKSVADIRKKSSPASHSSKEAQFPDDLQSSAEPLSNVQEEEQRKSASLKSGSLRSAGLITDTIHENVEQETNSSIHDASSIEHEAGTARSSLKSTQEKACLTDCGSNCAIERKTRCRCCGCTNVVAIDKDNLEISIRPSSSEKNINNIDLTSPNIPQGRRFSAEPYSKESHKNLLGDIPENTETCSEEEVTSLDLPHAHAYKNESINEVQLRSISNHSQNASPHKSISSISKDENKQTSEQLMESASDKDTPSALDVEHTLRKERSSADRSLKDLDMIANKADKTPKSLPELDIKSQKSTTRRVTIESLRDLYEKRSSIDHSIKSLEHVIQNLVDTTENDNKHEESHKDTPSLEDTPGSPHKVNKMESELNTTNHKSSVISLTEKSSSLNRSTISNLKDLFRKRSSIDRSITDLENQIEQELDKLADADEGTKTELSTEHRSGSIKSLKDSETRPSLKALNEKLSSGDPFSTDFHEVVENKNEEHGPKPERNKCSVTSMGENLEDCSCPELVEPSNTEQTPKDRKSSTISLGDAFKKMFTMSSSTDFSKPSKNEVEETSKSSQVTIPELNIEQRKSSNASMKSKRSSSHRSLTEIHKQRSPVHSSNKDLAVVVENEVEDSDKMTSPGPTSSIELKNISPLDYSSEEEHTFHPSASNFEKEITSHDLDSPEELKIESSSLNKISINGSSKDFANPTKNEMEKTSKSSQLTIPELNIEQRKSSNASMKSKRSSSHRSLTEINKQRSPVYSSNKDLAIVVENEVEDSDKMTSREQTSSVELKNISPLDYPSEERHKFHPSSSYFEKEITTHDLDSPEELKIEKSYEDKSSEVNIEYGRSVKSLKNSNDATFPEIVRKNSSTQTGSVSPTNDSSTTTEPDKPSSKDDVVKYYLNKVQSWESNNMLFLCDCANVATEDTATKDKDDNISNSTSQKQFHGDSKTKADPLEVPKSKRDDIISNNNTSKQSQNTRASRTSTDALGVPKPTTDDIISKNASKQSHGTHDSETSTDPLEVPKPTANDIISKSISKLSHGTHDSETITDPLGVSKPIEDDTISKNTSKQSHGTHDSETSTDPLEVPKPTTEDLISKSTSKQSHGTHDSETNTDPLGVAKSTEDDIILQSTLSKQSHGTHDSETSTDPLGVPKPSTDNVISKSTSKQSHGTHDSETNTDPLEVAKSIEDNVISKSTSKQSHGTHDSETNTDPLGVAKSIEDDIILQSPLSKLFHGTNGSEISTDRLEVPKPTTDNVISKSTSKQSHDTHDSETNTDPLEVTKSIENDIILQSTLSKQSHGTHDSETSTDPLGVPKHLNKDQSSESNNMLLCDCANVVIEDTATKDKDDIISRRSLSKQSHDTRDSQTSADSVEVPKTTTDDIISKSTSKLSHGTHDSETSTDPLEVPKPATDNIISKSTSKLSHGTHDSDPLEVPKTTTDDIISKNASKQSHGTHDSETSTDIAVIAKDLNSSRKSLSTEIETPNNIIISQEPAHSGESHTIDKDSSIKLEDDVIVLEKSNSLLIKESVTSVSKGDYDPTGSSDKISSVKLSSDLLIPTEQSHLMAVSSESTERMPGELNTGLSYNKLHFSPETSSHEIRPPAAEDHQQSCTCDETIKRLQSKIEAMEKFNNEALIKDLLNKINFLEQNYSQKKDNVSKGPHDEVGLFFVTQTRKELSEVPKHIFSHVESGDFDESDLKEEVASNFSTNSIIEPAPNKSIQTSNRIVKNKEIQSDAVFCPLHDHPVRGDHSNEEHLRILKLFMHSHLCSNCRSQVKNVSGKIHTPQVPQTITIEEGNIKKRARCVKCFVINEHRLTNSGKQPMRKDKLALAPYREKPLKSKLTETDKTSSKLSLETNKQTKGSSSEEKKCENKKSKRKNHWFLVLCKLCCYK